MSTIIFDKYEVIRRLAVGGMGEIFLARQTGVPGFDRLVIVKTLLPELAADHSFVQQFLDEARVAATLNHPNVVAVHEVGSWQGTYFIVMEYISGENVARLLTATMSAGERLPPALSARIVHDAALGLDHAHGAVNVEGSSLNVIHRDISPQNIMVRNDGVTKVVDFGIAKAANRLSRTRTGVLKGKLGYLAPEQVNDMHTDALSDQYSLGVVLWELCAGTRMVSGGDEVAMLKQVAGERAPLLASRVAELPDGLSDVVARMTATDPGQRFPSCGAVAKALRQTAGPTEDLGEFVRATVGDAIADRVADLTPTSEDFLVSLKPGRADPDAATAAIGVQPATGTPIDDGRRRWPWLVALLALTSMAAGAVWFQLWQKPPPATAESSMAPEPAPPPAVLVIDSDPAGAAVSLGVDELGVTPLRTELAACEGRLRVELDGYVAHERDLVLRAGEIREVTVALSRVVDTTKRKRKRRSKVRAPVAPDTAVGSGYVSVDTTPWTHVSIDGEAVDITPISKHRVAAGRRRVRLVNEEAGIDETQTILVEPNEVRKVRLRSSP